VTVEEGIAKVASSQLWHNSTATGPRHPMHEFAIRLRLVPAANTKLSNSIFDKLAHDRGLNTRDFKAPSAALGKVPRDHRFGPVRIDWVDMDTKENSNDKILGLGKGASTL
jgi:hypothetical protein